MNDLIYCFVRNAIWIATLLISTAMAYAMPLEGTGIYQGFSGPEIIPISESPLTLEVGDVDLDGRPEFYVWLGGTNNVLVLERDSKGTVHTVDTITIPGTGGRIGLADMTGDRIIDVVVAGNGIFIAAGVGDGTFDDAVNATLGQFPPAFAGDFDLSDIDSDGDCDIVFNTNSVSGTDPPIEGLELGPFVLKNHGDGTFGNAILLQSPGGGTPDGLTVADFNADGNDDIAVGSNTSFIRIFHGSGAGAFEYAYSLVIDPTSDELAHADLNGDDFIDLVMMSNQTFFQTWINSGGRLSGGSAGYGVGISPRDIELADFDNDGDPDVAVSLSPDEEISVFLNDGSGFMTPVDSLPGGSISWTVKSVDLDSNGSLDLVLLSRINGALRLYFNQLIVNPPTAFDLVSPPNGSTAIPLDPELSWTEASGDQVTYTVEVSEDGFDSLVHTSGPFSQTTTTHTIPTQILEKSSTYEWRVVASNPAGDTVANPGSFTFTTCLISDVNSDGCVNGSDLAFLLAAWGTNGAPVGADLNGDGIVNGADLATLLSEWTQ